MREKLLEIMKKKTGGMTLGKNGEPLNLYGGVYYQVSIEDGIITGDILEALKYIELGYNGIWYENGLFYIDKSITIDDYAKAHSVGILYNQLAIFDWENCKEIYL